MVVLPFLVDHDTRSLHQTGALQALLALLLGLEEELATAQAAQASAEQRVTELAEQLTTAEAVVDGLIRLARSGNRISGNEICGVLGVRRSVALERIRQAVAAGPAQEEVPTAADPGRSARRRR